MSQQPERTITLGLRPYIIHVKAILDDGREVRLTQKPEGKTGKPSQCTFFGELADGPFAITLRLDWSLKGIDANGEPTLDADIMVNGKNYYVNRKKWHHTPREHKNNEWVYDFEFENTRITFKLGLTCRREIQGTARIVAAPAVTSDDTSRRMRTPWAAGERKIFCAACQALTIQAVKVDHKNEILTSCRCGRYLHFPLTDTEEQFNRLLAVHEKANRF